MKNKNLKMLTFISCMLMTSLLCCSYGSYSFKRYPEFKENTREHQEFIAKLSPQAKTTFINCVKTLAAIKRSRSYSEENTHILIEVLNKIEEHTELNEQAHILKKDFYTSTGCPGPKDHRFKNNCTIS